MKEESRQRHLCPCVHRARGLDLHYFGTGQIKNTASQQVPDQLSFARLYTLEKGEYVIIILYLPHKLAKFLGHREQM